MVGQAGVREGVKRMSIWPEISPERLAKLWIDAISMRREKYRDHEFFTIPEFWNEMIDDQKNWSSTPYKSGLGDDFLRKASVTTFGEKVTLVADEELWKRARKGCPFCNFILGHELALAWLCREHELRPEF